MLKFLTQIPFQLTAALSIFLSQAGSIALAGDLPPKEVITSMYAGIRDLEGNKGTPGLKVVNAGAAPSPCGTVSSTIYCPSNHTIYITTQDIKMAYKYGDAALAFIIAHEYGHAMQTYGKFMPEGGMMSELQADCLAGYYIGSVKTLRFDETDLRKIEGIAKFLGDYHFESSQHHGTPKQRAAAVFAGFRSQIHKQNPKICKVDLLPQAIQSALQKGPNQ
jgi:uncharacterized protein